MGKKTKRILSSQKSGHREISVVLSLLSVPPLRVHENGPPTFPVDRPVFQVLPLVDLTIMQLGFLLTSSGMADTNSLTNLVNY